jgi:hypothetical protein
MSGSAFSSQYRLRESGLREIAEVTAYSGIRVFRSIRDLDANQCAAGPRIIHTFLPEQHHKLDNGQRVFL